MLDSLIRYALPRSPLSADEPRFSKNNHAYMTCAQVNFSLESIINDCRGLRFPSDYFLLLMMNSL